MRREATVISTTLMLLLAGCIASPEDVESAASELESPLLDELAAYESSYTYASDAIVLRTNATLEGGTAAFWWQIPDGVILGDEDEDRWIEFLAAPVLLEEDRAALERWMLMAFLADEGQLALNSMAFGAPFEVRLGNTMGGITEEIERSIAPFHLAVGGDLREGGRIGFVVSGVASEDVELALVLLPLQEEWDDDEDLPEDTEEFLDFLAPHSRAALPPSGTGGMHQLSYYYEMGSGFGGQTLLSGPVQIDGGSTDAVLGSRRAMVVSTEFPSGGYGIAGAGYEGGSATGTWSASADAHGAVSAAEGTAVAFVGPAIGPTVGGYPYVLAMGDGEAPSATSLQLETTSVLGDGLYLVQVDLDRTLEELLGLPALTIQGVTGTSEAHADGKDLVLRLGDATLRAVGLAQG